MKIFNFLAPIHQRDPLLFRCGLFMIIFSLLLVIPMMVDHRQVMGINTWIKPIKFCISTGIFIWTIGWFLGDLPHGLFKWRKRLSWLFFIIMTIEIGVIVIQAARGVRSHFNFDTGIDALLFALMGIMIIINTVAVIVILLFYLFAKPKMDFVYLTSVRIGILIFLIASGVGGMILSNNGVSIGVENGGEGLPFLNWSTEGGDLRIAHFLGLHGLQTFPLFAWVFKKYSQFGERIRMMLLLLFTLVFSSIWSYIMINTLNGISIVDMI